MSAGEQSWEGQVSAVAALGDPIRRQLYGYVVRQSEPVSRDDAAAVFDLPRTTVAFHLDRLADAQLLDVIHQRRTGRAGPGAGRPTKLYRRSEHSVSISLPRRRYDLAGQILSSAFEHAERSGESPRSVLDERAYAFGKEVGETARPANIGEARDATLRALEAHGYEPSVDGESVVLVNCPFHILAQEHTELVCGMNRHLLDGLLAGLAPTGLTARLNPTPGHCCIRLDPAERDG